MASFTKGPNFRTPFGENSFLRSTRDVKTEHYTVSAASVAAETIDTFSQKVLQKGEVLAKITSGGEAGKVGPFAPATGTEVQSLTTTGTPTGGTFALSFQGQVTDPIAFNASAADVKAALVALDGIDAGDVNTAGGALPTAVTITFAGKLANKNVGQITVADNSLTGGSSPKPVVTTTTAGGGTAGATDGRENPENIVGINNTFLPWQLMERDVEVAVVVEARVYQKFCFQRNAAGARVALSDATAEAMRSKKDLAILFAA